MEELKKIVEEFQENEVAPYGNLPKETRYYISFAVLTTAGTPNVLAQEVSKALSEGISPESISESIMQCTPYVGYPKAMESRRSDEAGRRISSLTKQGDSFSKHPSGEGTGCSVCHFRPRSH